jgi:alanine racemase
MPRPLAAVIRLSALQHNLLIAKQRAPRSKIWAVVKANAYGHGLERGMRGFSEADGLALIELDGAIRLRELGWQKPILLLEGFFQPADLEIVAKYQLQTVVHCAEQIEMLERERLAGTIDVHLKINTGMNRLGFLPEQFRTAYARLQTISAVRSISSLTHFANAEDADNPALPINEQVSRFRNTVQGIPGEYSLSNSATVLLHPNLAGDWVRPGIMLYGGSPGGGTAKEFGLQPAMTLTSEIIGVQSVMPGDAIGYGSRYVATRPMQIGVVACGYADGYPRHAPNGTPILVDGVKTQIIGRVSMDMMTVDLTPVTNPHIGSKVTLWGEGLPIDEVANAAGTIGYELMCALAPRVRVVEQ